MAKYEDLKKKVTKKKASKKKTAKKAPSKTRGRRGAKGLQTKVPDNNRQIQKVATEMEVRQFARLWAKSGWDLLQAAAMMHPELKPKELAPVAESYRQSTHFSRVVEEVLREVNDRFILDQPSAEEILTRHATTSPLDFWNDEGTIKSVAEMRRMPRHAQLALRKLKVTTNETFDKDGNHLGTQTQTEVETWDPQKAIAQLARMKEWGRSEEEESLARLLQAAEKRLHSRVIDLNELDPED